MTSLGRGVFVPVPTFFKENEDLDLAAFDQHVEYLANSGIAGIVVLGSMGEACQKVQPQSQDHCWHL
ncbi:hypothetical protein G6F42_023875 [Rhizopus arrhizus]|nr:hypothetical protein G6F42_023875 [Rhizopus arrhizus]